MLRENTMAQQASPGYPREPSLNSPRAIAVLLLAIAGCKGSASSPIIAVPPGNPAQEPPAPVVAPPVFNERAEPSPSEEVATDPLAKEPISLEQLPVIQDDDYQRLKALRARVTRNSDGKYSVYVRLSPEFSDQSIDSVLLCPNVEDLTLECVSISDQGIEKIKDLKLSRLILNGSPVTHAAIEQLSQQPMADTLISLGLKEIPIADEHVAIFGKFKRLQRLDLSATLITDASLPALQLLRVSTLNVSNTKISAKGFQKLRELMPGTQVITEAKPGR